MKPDIVGKGIGGTALRFIENVARDQGFLLPFVWKTHAAYPYLKSMDMSNVRCLKAWDISLIADWILVVFKRFYNYVAISKKQELYKITHNRKA
ncbi:hypothetical protein ACX12E_10145 [Paenibacillus vandeheii]